MLEEAGPEKNRVVESVLFFLIATFIFLDVDVRVVVDFGSRF